MVISVRLLAKDMLAVVKKNVRIQYITQLIQWGQIGERANDNTDAKGTLT